MYNGDVQAGAYRAYYIAIVDLGGGPRVAISKCTAYPNRAMALISFRHPTKIGLSSRDAGGI